MDILRLIDECRLVVGDGAMGSQLIARGLPAETPGVLWNIEAPEYTQVYAQTVAKAQKRN